MSKEYCSEFIKLMLLMLLFTLPLVSLIFGFNMYYETYQENLRDFKVKLVPNEFNILSEFAPFEAGSIFNTFSGSADVRYTMHNSDIKNEDSLSAKLSNVFKQPKAYAKADFSAEQLIGRKNSESIQIEVGILNLVLQAGYFGIDKFNMTMMIIVEKYGNKYKGKSENFEFPNNTYVAGNFDYDYAQNKMNLMKFTLYENDTGRTDKILTINVISGKIYKENNTTYFSLLYLGILILWGTIGTNQIPRYGPDLNEIFITDRLTLALFIYLLMIKFKDFMILNYYMLYDDSIFLYMMYLGISFLIWIEIISGGLILEHFLSKSINDLSKPYIYYLSYIGIYACITVLSGIMGYNFDWVYKTTIGVTDSRLFYFQNSIWVPIVLINIYFKRRGKLETSICYAISIKTSMTLNFYSIFNGKHQSQFEEYSELIDVTFLHVMLIYFIQAQNAYGSRFMLPERFRGYKHNYARQLHVEIEPHNLCHTKIPEGDFGMIQLHKKGFYEERMIYDDYNNVRSIENLHAVTPGDHNFHYACLYENIRTEKKCPKCHKHIPGIFEFDD